MMKFSWVVDIAGSWKVVPNPVGGGLALLVDRGIPCEGHTQIFSHHATNTPELCDVESLMADKKAFYVEAIDRFCLLSQALGSDWREKDCLGAVFCHWLIRSIVTGAEEILNKRVE